MVFFGSVSATVLSSAMTLGKLRVAMLESLVFVAMTMTMYRL
jgi:hypothetical protein